MQYVYKYEYIYIYVFVYAIFVNEKYEYYSCIYNKLTMFDY